MTQITAIPRNTKQAASEILLALRRQSSLPDAQAEELLQWLRETRFDPLRCWVGEIAATLIRDRGGAAIKARIWQLCDTASEWELYFYLIALMNEADCKRLEPYIQRAAASSESVIQAFAAEMEWARESTPAGSHHKRLAPRRDGDGSL
jgi:hypothetical protein